MPPPNILQDQFERLKGELRVVTDKIAAKQTELQALQAERQAVQAAMTDIRDAYQAWKGTAP